MDITSLPTKGKNIIKSYSDFEFTVSDKKISGSIILTADKLEQVVINSSQINNSEKLFEILLPFIESEVEILLIGTGKTHQRLDQKIRQKMKEKNISIDEMTTAAACRTFNILTLEDRKVAALLLI